MRIHPSVRNFLATTTVQEFWRLISKSVPDSVPQGMEVVHSRLRERLTPAGKPIELAQYPTLDHASDSHGPIKLSDLFTEDLSRGNYSFCEHSAVSDCRTVLEQFRDRNEIEALCDFLSWMRTLQSRSEGMPIRSTDAATPTWALGGCI